MTRPESTASIAIIYRFQLNRLTQTGTDNLGVGKKQDELGRNGNMSKFEVVN
jgi:hypothetical protein